MRICRSVHGDAIQRRHGARDARRRHEAPLLLIVRFYIAADECSYARARARNTARAMLSLCI